MSKSRPRVLIPMALLLAAGGAPLQPVAADVKKRPTAVVPKARPQLRAHEPSLVPRVPRKRLPVRRDRMEDDTEPKVPKPPPHD